jgi:hypothetical protein
MTVSAHFDGKVTIPDELLDLEPNQALIVQIQPVGETGVKVAESALTWLESNATESFAVPTDLADRHDHYLYGVPTADKKE